MNLHLPCVSVFQRVVMNDCHTRPMPFATDSIVWPLVLGPCRDEVAPNPLGFVSNQASSSRRIWSTMKDYYFDDSISAALVVAVEKVVANNTDSDVLVEARRQQYYSGSPQRFGRVVGSNYFSTGEQFPLLVVLASLVQAAQE